MGPNGDDAAKLNDPSGASALTEAERQKGMDEMSEKFREMGSEVYVEEDPDGKSPT